MIQTNTTLVSSSDASTSSLCLFCHFLQGTLTTTFSTLIPSQSALEGIRIHLCNQLTVVDAGCHNSTRLLTLQKQNLPQISHNAKISLHEKSICSLKQHISASAKPVFLLLRLNVGCLRFCPAFQIRCSFFFPQWCWWDESQSIPLFFHFR